MEALWYFSGQNGLFSVPDQQIIINAQGELLPFASTCAEDATSIEDFIQLCSRHQYVILVGDQGQFNNQQLNAIPERLPCLGLLTPKTTDLARSQIEQHDVDGFIFAGMDHVDFATITKKITDDKRETNALQEEIKKYSDIAFTAMSSASEMGVVALLAETVQHIMDLDRLANTAINCVKDLGMEAVIQFRFDDKVRSYPNNISNSYKRLLDTTLSASARIVSHGRFLVFSFDHVQLLVTNAPVEDNDKYGRMRDILAHVASIVESRAKTLEVNQRLKMQQENTKMVMTLLEMASRDTRNSVKHIMTDLSLSLRHMAVGLDLTLTQESELIKLADHALESLEGLQEATSAVEEHFRSLLEELDEVASLLDSKKDESMDSDFESESSSSSKVELF